MPAETSSPFRQLALANWRSIVRDRRTFSVVLLFPFAFLGLFLLVDTVTTSGPFTVGVAPGPAADEVVLALSANDQLEVVRAGSPGEDQSRDLLGSLDGLVVADAGLTGPVTVVTAGSAGPSDAVEDALAEAGVDRDRVEATTVDGGEPLDPFRFGLPSVLILSFASLVLFGTAIPIISLRERGTLRLLGTTPLARTTFLLAQAPARFAIAFAQLGAMALLAGVTGFLEPGAIASLLLTSVFGLALLFSLGYLAAGLLRSTELATSTLGTVLPFSLFLSGIFVPLSVLPDSLRAVAPYVPLSYLGDALRQDLVGLPGEYSRGLSYGVMLGAAVVATALAARTFSWDQGD